VGNVVARVRVRKEWATTLSVYKVNIRSILSYHGKAGRVFRKTLALKGLSAISACFFLL
jgi:hypothetical protein